LGIFIKIDIDQTHITPEIAKKVVSLCPVDIFTFANRQLTVQEEQVDECTLCELCLEAAPAGALVIRKLYKDEQLISC